VHGIDVEVEVDVGSAFMKDRKCCGISQEGEKLPENAVTRLGLSAGAHDRISKVARTIGDLEAVTGYSVETPGAKPSSTEPWTAAIGPSDLALAAAPLTWVYPLCYE
jgi:hypothetical protein